MRRNLLLTAATDDASATANVSLVESFVAKYGKALDKNHVKFICQASNIFFPFFFSGQT